MLRTIATLPPQIEAQASTLAQKVIFYARTGLTADQIAYDIAPSEIPLSDPAARVRAGRRRFRMVWAEIARLLRAHRA